MDVISRKEWGARHEDGSGPAPEPAREVWLHHTVTLAPDVGWLDANGDGVDDSEVKAIRQIEAIGEQRFGRGMSYNRLVVPSGRIYAGVSWGRKGAHLAGRNSVARSYALVGNYDVEPVTDAQIDAIARDLVQAWRAGHLDAPTLDGGHGSAPGAATACPGRNGRAAIPLIRDRIASLLTIKPAPPEVGMPLTSDDLARIRDAVWGSPINWGSAPGFSGGPQRADAVLRHGAAHAEFAARDAATLGAAVASVAKVANVDEAAIAKAVAPALAAAIVPAVVQAIADALPAKLARQVADVFAQRLAD